MASVGPEQKYDIFLVHSTDDSAVAMQINEKLKANGYSTWAHYKEGNEFDIGKPIFDNIIQAVELSKVILILVTKNALKSEWVTLEMLLAFEKSHRDDSLCARLVFEGVTEEEKKSFLTGDLVLIPSVTVDFNKDNWFYGLKETIEEKVSMTKLLPAGNVAVGLVYNYFVGYLRIILPALEDAIKASDYNKDGKMFQRFLLLIPKSSRIAVIEGQHGDYFIKKMEKSLAIEATHGDKKRSYNPAVYSISYKDSEPYYFVGECPFILETMHKINEHKFSNIDLRFQVKRFSLTLLELVNHRHNEQCHNTVHLISYDEADGFPAEAMWKAFHEELRQDGSPQVQKKVMKKEGKLDGTSDPESTVYVTNIDSDADKQTADQVIQFLKDNKVNFTNGDGGLELQSMKKASFYVFILSEEAIRDTHFKVQYDSAMKEGVSDNEVKVVGVLTKGMDVKLLPQNYSWITQLKEDEPEYLSKLWNAIQVKKRMTESIPVGKVFEGLCYAYLLNYLGLAVTGTTADGKGFRQRFEDAMTQFSAGCPCVPRVFIIVPKSCTFPGPGSQFANEEHLGSLEPVVMGFRKYFLQLYRLTLNNGQKVCYAREYATPAITLHEMANTIPFSGLTKQAMNEQAKAFSDLVSQLINDDTFNENVQKLKDKVSMVYFDDEKEQQEGMTRELEKKLHECLEDKDFIDFK